MIEILNKREAYLIGVYLGDGHVSKSKSKQFTLASIDLDLIKRTIKYIKKCFPDFDGKTNIQKYERKGRMKGKMYRIDIYCQELCDFLVKKTKRKEKLPKLKKKKLVKALIAGLMDTDGWIAENFSRTEKIWKWQMGFAVSQPWLKDVKILLQQYNIKSGEVQRVTQKTSPNWNDCYRIYINIRDFIAAKFYFTIKRKKQRLENYKKHFNISTNPQRLNAEPQLKVG